jgi:hypothetical protein
MNMDQESAKILAKGLYELGFSPLAVAVGAEIGKLWRHQDGRSVMIVGDLVLASGPLYTLHWSAKVGKRLSSGVRGLFVGKEKAEAEGFLLLGELTNKTYPPADENEHWTPQPSNEGRYTAKNWDDYITVAVTQLDF